MDTSDMVRRLKIDKKSTTSETDGLEKARHGKWNLMGSSSMSPKHQNGFIGSTSTENVDDEEPTLVKIKRLESTKYRKPPPLLQSKNVNNLLPVLPPRSSKSKVKNPSLNNINEEDGEIPSPTLPPPALPKQNDHDSEPPKRPSRSKQTKRTAVQLSTKSALSSLENILNVINNVDNNLDNFIEIVEEFRISLKDCRFYRVIRQPTNYEAHLLVSFYSFVKSFISFMQ
ncbi:hypothetical protein BLA29_008610 [Euroglyphus maynei]|uniref:Uncharacterized protein n=1 Tax=Euroglyphus maynei TaxID=6958 RepID=A0A1Y3AUM2_EURMA|nr:hypothetical protein BLA29_008610 [Euroglyphus maynei]